MVASVLPSISLPVTSCSDPHLLGPLVDCVLFADDVRLAITASYPFYGGATGLLLALLSLQAFLYRGSKGPKAYFGDQNTPEAPQLQSIVRVGIEFKKCMQLSRLFCWLLTFCGHGIVAVSGQSCRVFCCIFCVVRVAGVQQSCRHLCLEHPGAGVSLQKLVHNALVLSMSMRHSYSTFHVMCCRFLTARLSHAFQITNPEKHPVLFRAYGFLGTFVPLAVVSFLNAQYGYSNK